MSTDDSTAERLGEDQTAAALKQLLRGLAHNHLPDVYGGYRTLYRAGTAAIPELRAVISQTDWKSLARTHELSVLTTIVSIIHDIDESASSSVVDEILGNGCHPVVARALSSVRRYRNQDYTVYEVCGINIYESKKISKKLPVKPYLEKWLAEIPPSDLTHIERIYIVRHQEGMDYAGKYMPMLCKITLIWEQRSPIWLPLWLLYLTVENTLYHEIGHHVGRHTFGRDPEQEAEANRYAHRLMAKTHPRLSLVARAFRFVAGRRLKC